MRWVGRGVDYVASGGPEEVKNDVKIISAYEAGWACSYFVAAKPGPQGRRCIEEVRE